MPGISRISKERQPQTSTEGNGKKSWPERKARFKRPDSDTLSEGHWLTKALDYDLSKVAERKSSQGKFYPSALGNLCDRFLYMHYRGMVPQEVVEPRIRRIFDNGSSAEGRFKTYFQKMGVFVDDEVSVKNNSPLISGRLDFIIRQMPHGSRFVVELKTINDKGFKELLKADAPKHEHMVQLQIYLNLLPADSGGVMYENKNDQTLKIFAMDRDQGVWDAIIARCNRIINLTEMPSLESVRTIHDKYCPCLQIGQ
jgi:hypothetical protein